MGTLICANCCQSGLWVGQILKGFCNGYFGRDSYGEKRIEAVGPDWIVVRDYEYSFRDNENGTPNLARFDSHEQMHELVADWFEETKNGVWG